MADKNIKIINQTQKEIAILQKEQVLLLKKLDKIFKTLQTSLNISNKENDINDLSITSIYDLYDVIYNRKDDYILRILNNRTVFKEDKDKILSRLNILNEEIQNKKIELLLFKVKKLEKTLN